MHSNILNKKGEIMATLRHLRDLLSKK
jgi:hypothetical protein